MPADLLTATMATQLNLALATRNICEFDHCGIQRFNPFIDNIKSQQ
jgi:predicted nucleic acid-binding protein